MSTQKRDGGEHEKDDEHDEKKTIDDAGHFTPLSTLRQAAICWESTRDESRAASDLPCFQRVASLERRRVSIGVNCFAAVFEVQKRWLLFNWGIHVHAQPAS